MWRRLQTLFLLAATALVVSMFFSLKAYIPGPGRTHLQEWTYLKYYPYAVLLALITVLQLISVGTYNFMVLQLRTTVLSSLLLLALQGWLAVDFVSSGKEVIFSVTAVFPLLALILDALAARYILRDQLMVESINKERSWKKNGKKGYI